MNKSIIIFPALVFLFLNCFNSNSQYNTDFESNVFLSYINDSANVYDLLHAINYDTELYRQGKSQINAHINSLKAKNIENKSLKKQIDIIYKSTHSKFLKKYEVKAFFNNIFDNGNYNCVTASALYALILDEFNINYAIKETPSHVYLIADTLGLQVLLESTLPGNGIITFNEKFKKDFISYLRKNKIISNSEYNNFSTEELFKKYYSKDKTINKENLSALQYYNKGIFLFDDEKYSGAASNFSKALNIYPSHSIKYMQYASLQNALSNDYNKKIYDGKLLGQLIKSNSKDSNSARLTTDFFQNVSLELCITSPDIQRYNAYYKDILSQCTYKEIPVNIIAKYHYYKAYNYAANSNYYSSLSEIKKAHELAPENLLIKELAVEIGVKHLFTESRYKRQIDSMEYYFEELPFLLENNLYQQQYVYYYMKVISNSFAYNESKEGLKYYKRFLFVQKENNLTHYSEDHINIAFANMAFFYMNKTEFTNAQKSIDKGLELAPESIQLKQLKEEIKNVKRAMSYNSRNNASSQNNDIVFIDNYISPQEKQKEDVSKYFPGKWRAVSIIMEDMEQKLNQKEVFEFYSEKNKNCSFTQNGKTETGKWSYRMKSKCIYFVPDHNKDEYKVYKVKEISANKIILLPYKDQKRPSPYKYVLKPF